MQTEQHLYTYSELNLSAQIVATLEWLEIHGTAKYVGTTPYELDQAINASNQLFTQSGYILNKETMRTYTMITLDNSDILFLVNIDGATVKLRHPLNQFSKTYGALSLTVYDDAFKVLKNNPWLLDLDFYPDAVEKALKHQGLKATEPSPMQKFIYIDMQNK